jgi:hypothetical protein
VDAELLIGFVPCALPFAPLKRMGFDKFSEFVPGPEPRRTVGGTALPARVDWGDGGTDSCENVEREARLRQHSCAAVAQ